MVVVAGHRRRRIRPATDAAATPAAPKPWPAGSPRRGPRVPPRQRPRRPPWRPPGRRSLPVSSARRHSGLRCFHSDDGAADVAGLFRCLLLEQLRGGRLVLTDMVEAPLRRTPYPVPWDSATPSWHACGANWSHCAPHMSHGEVTDPAAAISRRSLRIRARAWMRWACAPNRRPAATVLRKPLGTGVAPQVTPVCAICEPSWRRRWLLLGCSRGVRVSRSERSKCGSWGQHAVSGRRCLVPSPRSPHQWPGLLQPGRFVVDCSWPHPVVAGQCRLSLPPSRSQPPYATVKRWLFCNHVCHHDDPAHPR
ncbi:hypothetical protein EDD92_9822 [Streptomyces sp. TLI_185]|nr:hypothetical protein EDD92_9822 [Streptomyces sp. TLI_185]